MIKNIFILISTFVLLQPFRHQQSTVDEAKIDICRVENSSFQDGETVVYKLYYNWNFIWLSAGEVIFKVKEYDDYYHLSASGSTYPSYEWFFKVRDYFESKVDKETLLPKSSIRNVHEGKYTRYDYIEFDQDNQKAFYKWGKNQDADLKEDTADLSGCVHDIISIFYCLRNTEVESIPDGGSFPVEVFLDKEVWPLKVNVASKSKEQRIKGFGKVETLHIKPELVAGSVFNEGAEMNVYVSNDENKVPLMIESPVSVGSVKAVIKGWYGLKKPFVLEK